ncbi:MAG: hypothetical protein HYY23_02445 [Verrucomicrobia bacterium]|nr:hypothetical protein [Verrucomicrobiota bacterium]
MRPQFILRIVTSRILPVLISPALFTAHLLISAHAAEYLEAQHLARQLESLKAAHGALVHINQPAESLKKNPIWVVELGNGTEEERRRRPAMLLVAGIEGNDLAGTSSAVHWMRQLADGYANDNATKRLLDSTTLYIFPRLNPDAAASFFAVPKQESPVNGKPVDEDHDGLIDEDGPEDLNGDGLITWMRIEDPEGEYILDAADPRLVMKADKSKGERGRWRYLVEGRDNDRDEAWNEDGPGGVNLNRNFPYNYQFFAGTGGLHQMSEIETRALADFIVDHANIGIVFTFGSVDNLVQTPKAEPGGKRPPTAIQERDLPFYRELGKAYRDPIGLKKELQGNSEPGTFSDWMYYHRGRLSLAAKPWSPALQIELAKTKTEKGTDKPKDDTTAAKPEPKKDDKKEPEKPASDPKPDAKAPADVDKRNEEERAFLKWIDANAPALFVPWKVFEHPDFPNRKVEIGGFAPFARTNPPQKQLDEFAEKHAKFLTSLADKLPRVGFQRAEAKHLGESVYEIVVKVENTGYLPTALAQGVTTREVLPTRLVFDVDKNDILAGLKSSALGPIEGSGGVMEIRCTLRAKGRTRLGVEVISALGGTVRTTIELPKAAP